ncbi:MAG: hypothetical protein AAF647_08035 [Pseudomonadota bacterium]
MFKKFAIAATAIALTAGAAAAGTGFGHQDSFDKGDNVVELDLVRSASAGTLIVETLKGDVLGSTMIDAGANNDVLVNLRGAGVQDDVIAKIVIDGETQSSISVRAN